MTPSLKNKLRMMDAGQSLRTDPSSALPCQPAPKESGDFYYLRKSFPFSNFCDRKHASPEHMSAIFGMEFPKNLKETDFLFLDTETTGLSSGAGTIAFQVGLGYLENNAFVAEQFCMRDYHEEAAMLREVSARLARFPVLVTFNGRTFDIPLLKSRLLINRLRPDCIPELHADALFPARRLWKLRLGSCRLSRLEEAVLGITRTDDLPGALVPQTYFQYLKDRDFAPIERILEHNRQDIVSLAQLFFFLCMQYAKPEDIAYGEDLLSLAKAYGKSGHTAKAVKCYRLSAKGDTRGKAYEALAAYEKRQGHADHAIRLYEAMARQGENPVLAYEALAKLAEHQKGDVEQALHYTRQALLFLAEPSLLTNESVQSARIAIQYRYARLLRKQGTQKHPQSQEVIR